LSSSAGRAGSEEAMMSEAIEVRAADRAARLLRAGVLLAGLAAILFVSYGLVTPLPYGLSLWRWPIGIATAGGLALLLAWPSRRAGARTRTADETAVMLGAASMIAGIGAAIIVAYGVAANVEDNLESAQALAYRLTHPSVVVSVLALAVPSAISGILSLVMARRRARAVGRVSAAATAVRFSIVGLVCAGLIAATAATAAVYRWLTWG
jgi:hypothetical protein